MFGFKIGKDYRNLPDKELKRAYYDLSHKLEIDKNTKETLLVLQKELTKRNIVIGSLFIDMDLEYLLALLTRAGYEVQINRDLHDNGKDKVWVVDLYHYATDNSVHSCRGLLNQSLQELLIHICRNYKIIE